MEDLTQQPTEKYLYDDNNPISSLLNVPEDFSFRLQQVELFHIKIPLKQPFKVSFGILTHKEAVIVRVTTPDKITGIGEASSLPIPGYKPESTAISFLTLKKHILPLLRRNLSLKTFYAILKKVKGLYFAKSGIEMAIIDLTAKLTGQSIIQLINAQANKPVYVGESIGIKNNTAELLHAVEHALDRGYRRIKLKIMPNKDLEYVSTVRKKFKDIPLMVDANSSYRLKHLDLLKELDTYTLLMIEQPLQDDDIVYHSFLTKAISTPICLDESINNVYDLHRAYVLEAINILNLKPNRVGGVIESLKLHHLSQRLNIPIWIGGMFETSVGKLFNIAMAKLPNVKYPADMSLPTETFSDDITNETFSIEDGIAKYSFNTPGIGVTLNEDKLRRYTIDFYRHSFS